MARMMRISILKMGQRSEDDGGFWLLKCVHVVHALGLLHRLLVPIRYVDGSATTPALDMGGESTPHYRVLGVSDGFGWLDVFSCQIFVK